MSNGEIFRRRNLPLWEVGGHVKNVPPQPRIDWKITALRLLKSESDFPVGSQLVGARFQRAQTLTSGTLKTCRHNLGSTGK